MRVLIIIRKHHCAAIPALVTHGVKEDVQGADSRPGHSEERRYPVGFENVTCS